LKKIFDEICDHDFEKYFLARLLPEVLIILPILLLSVANSESNPYPINFP
jgi:hypothetical protein